MIFVHFLLGRVKSSHQRCSVFYKKSVLNNFTKFTGKPVPESLFLVCNFIKKRLWHRCFLVSFAKLLRTPVLKNICEKLLRETGSVVSVLSIIKMYAVQNAHFKYSWTLRASLVKFSLRFYSK